MINRSEAPKVSIPENLNILNFKSIKSANNIDIHYINSGSQDVIRVSVVFKAGVKYQSKVFQASSMVSMLAEGTKNYTAEAFAEKIDFYGIYFDQSIDRDYSIVTVCCLKRFLNEALDVLCETLTTPQFPEKEFEILKNKRKQTLLIEREKINVVARELFIKTLFGEQHPYGVVGNIEDFDNLSVSDLKDFFNEFYCAENCFSVVTGLVNEEDLQKISSTLEQIRSGKSSQFVKAAPTSKSEAFIEKENALQSSIRVGKLLFTREHPDFTPLQVLTTALGGYFGSRLVKNLREDKGYTYGVSAMMINLEDSGYFAVTSEVAAEYTSDAIEQIYVEIKRLRDELIPQEELDMVKNVMIGEFLRVLDGPFGINDVAIENIQNGTDNSYLLKMIQDIKTVTSEDLRALAQKYLQEDSFTTICVGKNWK